MHPKTFQYFPPEAPLEEQLQFIQRMRDLLRALTAGDIPNDQDYTGDTLRMYCQSLVAGQRDSLGRTVAGSWSVAANDDGMPADARVDFIFVPTYIAVATLTLVRVRYPAIVAGISGFDESLRRGMVFATHRGLQGHGYEGMDGLLDAVRTLAEGSVPEFLSTHPDFCPELLQLLRNIKQDVGDPKVQKALNALPDEMKA